MLAYNYVNNKNILRARVNTKQKQSTQIGSTRVSVQVPNIASQPLFCTILNVMDMTISNMGSNFSYGYSSKQRDLKQVRDCLAQSKICTLDCLADKIAEFSIITRRSRGNYLSFLFAAAKTGETQSAHFFSNEMDDVYSIYPGLKDRTAGFLATRSPSLPEDNTSPKKQAISL